MKTRSIWLSASAMLLAAVMCASGAVYAASTTTNADGSVSQNVVPFFNGSPASKSNPFPAGCQYLASPTAAPTGSIIPFLCDAQGRPIFNLNGTMSSTISGALPAGSNTIGNVNLNNSENHIGWVGGHTVSLTPTSLAVTASSAYSSGQFLGGLLTFTSATRLSAGSGLLQTAILADASKQNALVDLILFNANPSSTTVTDKTTADIAAADLPKVIGVAHITDCISLSTRGLCLAQTQAIPVTLASGTTLYGVMVVRGTPTYPSTSAVGLTLTFLQD